MPIKSSQNRVSGRKVLGRGLKNLFAENSDELSSVPEVSQLKRMEKSNRSSQVSLFVPIEQLSPGDHQPRKIFNRESLMELADSIKKNGIIQPILARKKDFQKYEIIAGERRWRAAGLAGLYKVPVWLTEDNAQKNSSVLALVENIQRQDLSSIETAKAYRNIMKEQGFTQEQLAEQLGQKRASIANHLRLLNLAPKVQELIMNKQLSFALAKILLKEKDFKQQLYWAEFFISNNLGVREAEKVLNKGFRAKKPLLTAQIPDWAEQAVKKIQDKHGVKVSLKLKRRGGDISLRFYSDEELHYLMDRLLCLQTEK